jgi:hypothetical protein
MDNTNPPQFRGRPFMPARGFEGHGGGGSTLEWVIFALQLLMLAALAVLLIRAFTRRGPRFAGPPPWVRSRHAGPGAQGQQGPHDPVEHLRMRYARGEISRDEYLQATSDLGGDAPTGELP